MIRPTVAIAPPNMLTATFGITGIEPLMTARFSKKAELMAKMSEGRAAGNKKNRSARDYDKEAEDAAYFCTDPATGEKWYGVHAASFRNALISACRLVGYKMTIAKMSVFVIADGHDDRDQTPLVRIIEKGGPALGERRLKVVGKTPYLVNTMHTRNATGVTDVRSRPLWEPGWAATLHIRYDADQFSATDVANLLNRVGMQVGIGEGRPDSKASNGLGFGLFEVQGEMISEIPTGTDEAPVPAVAKAKRGRPAG